MLQLTAENYYSTEANQEYMSVSQYKDFLNCEAAAMAKLYGGWEEPANDAFLLGSYVHAWNEGVLDQFKAEHPELISSQGASKGQLKAPYKVADSMIETLKNDELCMMALQGEHEVIYTGEIAGYPFKIKVDSINHEAKRFSDLKTCRSISEGIYVREMGYVSFIEAYGYLTGLAVYQEIIRQNLDTYEPFIVAVSKEEVPDKAVIFCDEDRLGWELDQVKSHLPHILEVKIRKIEPIRCEKCRYCRETKKVNRVLHYSELIG